MQNNTQRQQCYHHWITQINTTKQQSQSIVDPKSRIQQKYQGIEKQMAEIKGFSKKIWL